MGEEAILPSAGHDVPVTVAGSRRRSAMEDRDARLAKRTILLAPTPLEGDAMLEVSELMHDVGPSELPPLTPGFNYSYCRMRDVYDEAVQRLYWACRRRRDFPGDVPDESMGAVTTDAILHGLGLIGPGHEDPTVPMAAGETRKDADSSAEEIGPDQDHHQLLTRLSTAEGSTPNDQGDLSPTTTRSSFSSSSRSYDGSAMSSVPSLTQVTTTATTADMGFDMNVDAPPQGIHYSSSASSRSTNLDSMTATPTMTNNHTCYGVDVESYLNVDAFLDANFCGMPDSDASVSMGIFNDAMTFKSHHGGHVNGSLFPGQQTFSPTKGDGYLSPWPGSLAAVYSSAP
ncbi:hypothetical protein PV08_10606 [Exophiala spinifera]|uniref:Uncharacterized protein n=1 Tax=Exophiala spinifera TaxID=91928 RepID=A0A0D1Y8I4_9EURO|nr:uncharacterized protein PV08_10606 [Exophiala spinifera]KIW11306.1 hypothetical protein PV08_10606 [Exophiala spinifera]